ncbi:MAG: hypothetical protein SFZ02_02590 [bacterium]|nr:hypothetical protein [bacterium]
MLIINTPPQHMEIIQHPHDFYEFIFKAKSPGHLAFDEWLIYIEQIYQFPKTTPVKILTDTRAIGSVPLAYAFRKGQPLVAKYPSRPKPIRSVFWGIESNAILEKMLKSFLQLLRTGDHYMVVYGDARKEALDFLFIHEPDHHPENIK